MGLLRMNKGPFYPLGTAKIGRQERGSQEWKQQLAQSKDIRDGREGKCLYRQQQGDEQPDNIVLRDQRAPLKERDGQPERVIPHGDGKQQRSEPQRQMSGAHGAEQGIRLRRHESISKKQQR